MSKSISLRPLRASIALATAILSAVASCSEQNDPITQAVVAVSAEPQLAANLHLLRVSLFPRDAVQGSSPSTVTTIPVGPGVEADGARRLSFGIQQRHARELLVVVRGCADENCSRELAEQKVYLLFQPRRTVLVPVLLTSACSDASTRCARLDQTCAPTARAGIRAGECGAIPAPESTIVLPGSEVYPEIPLLPVDAGMLDASVEPTVDAQLPSTRECPANNTCQPDYPCERDQGTGYICRGQFADWPMPDSSHDAGVAASYDTTREALVLDRVTGLEWERDTQGVYPGCTGRFLRLGDRCSWEEARSYCKSLVLHGTGWRLPSKIELESLLDLRPDAPGIDPAFSFAVTSNLYWSNSPNSAPALTDEAYGVGFDDLPIKSRKKSSRELVRCVRSPMEPVRPLGSRYMHNLTTGEVSDLRTGLTWTRTAICEGMERYEDADALCTSVRARLPTAKELLTLTDPTVPTDKFTAATDPLFATPPHVWFWSSTWSKGRSGRLLVGSALGLIYSEPSLRDQRMSLPELAQPSCARCVKGSH